MDITAAHVKYLGSKAPISMEKLPFSFFEVRYLGISFRQGLVSF